MKKLKTIIILATLSILTTTIGIRSQRLERGVTVESLKKHIEFLGSDSLQGRGTGTVGGRMAARYIADQLQKYGLTPISDQQTFFQSIPMHGSTPLPDCKLQLFSDSLIYNFQLKRDYLLYKTGAQTFIPQPVPLVFVGYGIIAPEFDYNDYQSVDVEGKIVVFLSGEPPSNDATYFNGTDPTIYAYPESKQRIAISRGALGSILIPSPREDRCRKWIHWINTFSFEDVTLAYAVTGNLSIVMNPNAAQKLFDNGDFTLQQIFDMDRHGMLTSFEMHTKLSFHGKFLERDFFSSNIVALLRGKIVPPHDQYVLISAHYDHLGIGKSVKGDSIYNGVFDNAAGVAALLEIARALSQCMERQKNSIIFLFITGEEKGLLGSTYYTDHPIVPLYKTIANVNIDGLSMFDEVNDIVGVGAEYSTLGLELEKVASKLGLGISPIPTEFIVSESFARSDQIAFAKAGLPSILIAEGLSHKHISQKEALDKMIKWMDEIYHTPFDDLNQQISYPAFKQHTEIILEFIIHLANLPKAPTWYSGTPYINERLRSIAERR